MAGYGAFHSGGIQSIARHEPQICMADGQFRGIAQKCRDGVPLFQGPGEDLAAGSSGRAEQDQIHCCLHKISYGW